MVYIKKLVMNGFKSFANKTEIPFDRGINVIIGPNGSGKSNVSDALCFVLGRLSIKSMRASKASNLIFQGSKERKPSHEASVELIFDNYDKSLPIDSNEVSLKRIVRSNGQGIYKIGNETKTRQEILELLAKAGIDPHGFNLVLQGEIQRFVKMRPEERREVIEEIAGISIYETRKQKALHEIERTEQKLKEVSAVLRERTSYLKNLEEERKQALKFKELEKTIKNCKATILKKQIDEKVKSKEIIDNELEKNIKWKEKVKSEIEALNLEVHGIESRINEMNNYIQKTTGLEKDNLSEEIVNLNAKLAALKTKRENFQKRIDDDVLRKKEIEENLRDEELTLEELKKESPKVSKRQIQLSEKKKELDKIQEEREKIYTAKNEINTLKERIKDKEKILENFKIESKKVYNEIELLSRSLKFNEKSFAEKEIDKIKAKISSLEIEINTIDGRIIEYQKSISLSEIEIKKSEKIILNIPNSELCPLCRTKLDELHIKEVISGEQLKISESKKEIEKLNKEINYEKKEKEKFFSLLLNLKNSLEKIEGEIVLIEKIEDKKSYMRSIIEREKTIEDEILDFNSKIKKIEEKIKTKDIIEEKYNRLFFEMQELSSRTDENLNTTILYKEREIENMRNVIRTIEKGHIELEKELKDIEEKIVIFTKELSEKQISLEKLNKKFKDLYDERAKLQEKIKEKNALMLDKQNILYRFEEVVNTHKINLAKVSAELESIEFELKEFKDFQILPGNLEFLKDKLQKSEQTIRTIGSVNLRALETYDVIKKEYEKINEKVLQLETERDEIMKIIEEIDNKKKKTFMKTFKSINELFTRNFLQLSHKGQAFLELENPDDIFSGGLSITIKVGKGKYFDVTSLSGGEQTLVALSLIFAIQEYKPYHFYILDEVDAALDKRNSELLASLLRQYMKSGQYIVISHNDSIITNADTIYGVSMNNGISKVLSLQLNKNKQEFTKESIGQNRINDT